MNDGQPIGWMWSALPNQTATGPMIFVHLPTCIEIMSSEPNQDKPCDQFVREQLAGDEIDPQDFDHMIATGFLRHGVYEWNQVNARMQWELILMK